MKTINERQFVLTAPIILRRATASSSMKTSKKMTREVNRLEQHGVKAILRMVKAVEKGVAGYRSERKKDDKKKRGADNALSMLPAMLEGTTIAVRRMSLVPVDLTKAATSKQGRKLFGKATKTAASFAPRPSLK